MKKYLSLGSIKQIVTRPRLMLRVPRYLRQLRAYRRMELRKTGRLTPLRLYPCLNDDQETQSGYGYYFYQDCWAARQVFRENPLWMVDVGSTVLLVGILSQFAPCTSVDIRPIESNLEGLTVEAGSVLELPFKDGEVPLLTTMCVIEHIGLGRYGDPLNPTGTKDAVAEIARVIAPGGVVVYSVPVGREVNEFNANRRFRYAHAQQFFKGWEMVDSVLLTPHPEAFSSEQQVLALKEPVACFCMRKPL
ncbi:hypothetical protein IAD21_00403 [Abditibacteriota bacterium]|nr:hypothetical protein IAD21_00403 [Abditibacteriota bacterium]